MSPRSLLRPLTAALILAASLTMTPVRLEAADPGAAAPTGGAGGTPTDAAAPADGSGTDAPQGAAAGDNRHGAGIDPNG